MTQKHNRVWKAAVAFLLLAATVLNLCAFTVQETAAVLSSLLSSATSSGEETGGRQTVGGGDPTLNEIEIPTVQIGHPRTLHHRHTVCNPDTVFSFLHKRFCRIWNILST